MQLEESIDIETSSNHVEREHKEKNETIVEENIHNSEYDINGEYAIKIVNGNFSWGIKQHEGNKLRFAIKI